MKLAPLFSILLLTACSSTSEATSDPAPASEPAPTSAPKAPMPAPVPTPAPAPVPTPAPAAQTSTVTPAPTEDTRTQAQKFADWKTDFMARAAAQGYDQNLVTRIIGPAKINEKAIQRDRDQPEFTKPIWSYVDNVTSASRMNGGRAKLSETAAVFDTIDARYGVDRNVLTAIWGLESAYGRIQGKDDMIDSLATLAFDGRRRKFGEQNLLALLDMISAGTVRADQLQGSWAGAMGMPQFIPTTFRDYAVDLDGNGNIDIWQNAGDAMGSAANYLSRSGWRTGEPTLAEVKLPDAFNYGLADGKTRRTVREWKALGVAPANGKIWSDDAGFLDAKLLVPAGARGPKFLTFKNFDVIKRYNNSTSYALGIATLGMAFNGEKAISTDWPRSDQQLSRTQLKDMQRRLTALGFDTKGIDGQVGPNTRRAIREWQASLGLPADGYMESRLYARLLRP